MSKYFSYIAVMIFMITTACNRQKESAHDHASTAAPADTVKKSIPKEVHAQVGEAHIMMYYHAPAVRGRTIWGGLVPYGEVWVTGAHNATSFEINKNFSVNGTTIPAGKYAVFTIPGETKWTVIFNKNWDQHLTDEYDAKDDVVRTDVTPELQQESRERLNYDIVRNSDTSALLVIAWEKVKVTVPFGIVP